MSKGSKKRPIQVSQEEHALRWAIARREIQMSDEEFVKRIREIRERTGKPYTSTQRKALEDTR
jgi:methyl coenzyme M reductase subunit D